MVVRELLTKLGFDVDDAGLKKATTSINNIKRNLKFAAVGVIALGTAFLKMAGDMEQTEIAFETMTGSAETAQKLLQDLAAFAATTPFELTGLIQNAKKLLAFGFAADEIVEKMTNLGNIAAGVGRDKLPSIVLAFGKIRTKGKATMEELNIMLEAGVPILDELAKNMGVTTKQLTKMVSKGVVGFKDVDKALESLATGSGKFANLMIKQSKSFLGLVSNVGDFLEMFAIGVGKELLPQAKEFVKVLIEWLQANREIIKQNIVGFFQGLFSILKFIASIFRVITGFTGGFANLIKLIFIMGAAWKLATLDVAAFNAAVLLIPLIITAIITLIALLAEDIYQFFTGGESVMGAFFRKFKDTWKKIKKFASDTWDKITDFIKVKISQIINWFTSLPGKFVDLLKELGTELSEWFSSIGDSISQKFTAIIDTIKNAITKAKEFFGIGGGTERNAGTNSPSTTRGIVPSSIVRPGAVNNNSKSIKVNSNITLGVPPGTSESQKKSIKDFAEGAFAREFNKVMNTIDQNNPVTE
jgi:tape measure domain-containing protein